MTTGMSCYPIFPMAFVPMVRTEGCSSALSSGAVFCADITEKNRSIGCFGEFLLLYVCLIRATCGTISSRDIGAWKVPIVLRPNCLCEFDIAKTSFREEVANTYQHNAIAHPC
jgi:hypothetical protein